MEISKIEQRKAAESARRRKKLRELVELVGAMRPTTATVKTLTAMGVAPEDMTRDVAIVVALYKRAEKGDARAFELIAKIRGEMVDKVAADVALPRPLIDLTAVGGHKSDDVAEGEVVAGATTAGA